MRALSTVHYVTGRSFASSGLLSVPRSMGLHHRDSASSGGLNYSWERKGERWSNSQTGRNIKTGAECVANISPSHAGAGI
jgi:hypothetical protein